VADVYPHVVEEVVLGHTDGSGNQTVVEEWKPSLEEEGLLADELKVNDGHPHDNV